MYGIDYMVMKKAIVIGATSGIGRETAARLVEAGWMVGVTGRRVEALKSFKAEYGDNVHFMEMDVTREDAARGSLRQPFSIPTRNIR